MYTCSGILFNHGLHEGKTFVTRKISESVAKVKLGLIDKFKIGNLDAKEIGDMQKNMLKQCI